MTTPPPVNLLTEEVARRLRVGARTLERWRYLGLGPNYRRVGGRVIYPISEIEKYERGCDVILDKPKAARPLYIENDDPEFKSNLPF